MSDNQLFEYVIDTLREEDKQRLSSRYMQYPIYKSLSDEERQILGYSLLHESLFRMEWNITTLFNIMKSAIMSGTSHHINFPKLVRVFMQVYTKNIPDTKELMNELKEQN